MTSNQKASGDEVIIFSVKPLLKVIEKKQNSNNSFYWFNKNHKHFISFGGCFNNHRLAISKNFQEVYSIRQFRTFNKGNILNFEGAQCFASDKIKYVEYWELFSY